MSAADEKKHVVSIPHKLHLRVKTKALMTGVFLCEAVVEALEEWLEKR